MYLQIYEFYVYICIDGYSCLEYSLWLCPHFCFKCIVTCMYDVTKMHAAPNLSLSLNLSARRQQRATEYMKRQQNYVHH